MEPTLVDQFDNKHCPCPKAGGEHRPLGNPETLILTSPESRWSWRRKGGFGGKNQVRRCFKLLRWAIAFPSNISVTTLL